MLASCTRCEGTLEHGDLRCAVCALVLDAPAEALDVPRARVLRCTECGAAVSFSAEVQAPHCKFCRAVARIEHPVDPIERAEILLPFATSREDAHAALRAWLGRRGWLYPKDLAAGATIATLEPLHWAAWVVDARALVSWAADSDADSGRSDWAPHSGQTTMDFDGILVPASRGLTWAECATLTRGYDLRSARAVGDEPDATVEAFDAQRSAARRTVLSAIEATAAARLQRGTIPGRRFRNVKVGVLLQGLRTRRVVLPAWVLAYRYRGQPYRAVVHGQDVRYVLGKAPYSRAKIAALVAGGVALLAIIALVVAHVMAS
jgi:hypothetical protein